MTRSETIGPFLSDPFYTQTSSSLDSSTSSGALKHMLKRSVSRAYSWLHHHKAPCSWSRQSNPTSCNPCKNSCRAASHSVHLEGRKDQSATLSTTLPGVCSFIFNRVLVCRTTTPLLRLLALFQDAAYSTAIHGKCLHSAMPGHVTFHRTKARGGCDRLCNSATVPKHQQIPSPTPRLRSMARRLSSLTSHSVRNQLGRRQPHKVSSQSCS